MTDSLLSTPSIPPPLPVAGGTLMAYATRFTPGADLVSSMEKFASQAMAAASVSNATLLTEQSSSCSAPACFVLSAVGSLQSVTLRMANASRVGEDETENEDTRTWDQRLEIVSLVGTFSPTGKHLHMSVSDAHGNVFGGHVMSGTIYTTLELIVGVVPTVGFSRTIDPTTGYKELVVEQHEPTKPTT